MSFFYTKSRTCSFIVTIDKFIEMRLTSMADAFHNQLNDPEFKEVPFEDRFGMLVGKYCKFCSNGTPILKSAVHSF